MGARGPLPKPAEERARRNEPTIPTTNLPASGRQEPTPDLPAWITLNAAGAAWWEWAWHTPQAAAWSAGDTSTIARRAMLEGQLATIRNVDSLDIVLEDVADADTANQLKAIVGNLASLVTGSTSLAREMRELDNLLGLTPKGLAALRWKIVADKPADLVSIKDTPRQRRALPKK